jgi:cation:H+ antiporter
LSAIAAPLIVGARLLRQDVPAMIGSALLASLLAADGVVGRLDGCLLLGLAVAYTIHLVQEGRREGAGPDDGNGGKKKLPGIVLALFVLSGLALLVLGSDWFVEAAVRTAKAFGVSDLVVGLTIVAAGTSLPELAASVAASIKGERDIAVGNVVGSNIFNIFLVLGAAAVVAPNGVPVSEEAIRVHLPIMTGVCVACLPIFITGSKVDRVEGLLLFGGYLSYAAHLVLTATNHPSAAAFATAMSSVVVPIVAAYLIVSAWRRKSRAG